MPVTALNTTTLTSLLNATDKTFLVGSNANIAVGDSIVIGSELMTVQGKAGTTTVTVERGQSGTSGVAHNAASTVYGGFTSGIVNAVKDGLGGTRLQFSDVPVGSLPNYFLPLGTRVRDELGNEFILCDFNTTMYKSQPCSINSAFVADVLGTTGRGQVGVVAEVGTVTSDNWGWVQIFGRCNVMLGMSGVSPSDAASGPTTLSTSVQTRFMLGTSATSPNGIGWTNDAHASGYIVEGMTVATDASVGDVSSQTSITGHTGHQISVFLNYPRLTWQDVS